MTMQTQEILKRIKLQEPITHGSLTIHPILFDGAPGPGYRSLSSALDAGTAVVTEVDEGGSVPTLMLVNKSTDALLVLDGEELHGAKQNRVLNTTILVAAGAEVVIPVSCTEQGRWAYSSRQFSSSDQVMPHRARSRKMAAVSDSLKSVGAFSSNQGQVWNDVAMYSLDADVHSPTGAMNDTFESHRENLDGYLAAVPCGENQAGMLVLIDGKVVGMDFVSRSEVYAALHGKLVRSYAMDALIRERERSGELPLEEPGLPEGNQVADFLAAVAQCTGESFESVGLGEDVRFQGPDAIGTALLVDGDPIHGSFFSRPADRHDQSGGMRRSSRRASSLNDLIQRAGEEE